MSESIFHGHSTDGNNVTLSTGSQNIQFSWVFRCAIKGNVYFILELKENLTDTMKKGDTFVFRFTGDVESLNGDYVVEMNDDVFNEVWVRFEDYMDKNKDEQNKDPNEHGNGSNSTERKSIVDYNGVGWYKAKNICYILAIIWGIYATLSIIFVNAPGGLKFVAVGSPLLWLNLLFGAIFSGNDQMIYSATVSSSVILGFLPILSIVTAVMGFKERVRYGNTIHNAAMVLGLITINPFLLLAGYFNHHDIVLSNKVRPAKKGE